jgi:hypothetical protein
MEECSMCGVGLGELTSDSDRGMLEWFSQALSDGMSREE